MLFVRGKLFKTSDDLNIQVYCFPNSASLLQVIALSLYRPFHNLDGDG